MDWSSVIPNIVGGAITAGTAAGLFVLSRRFDRKEKEIEKKRKDARIALMAFDKILAAAEATINLSRSVDEEFGEARERSKDQDSELHEHVRPILGIGFDGDLISIDEAYFLAKGNDLAVFSECNVFIRRAKWNYLMLEKYNSEKIRFHDFLDTLQNADPEIGSTGITRTIRGDDLPKAVAFVGRLNNLIGLLIDALDRDKKEAQALVERFLSAARKEFGDNFPVKSLEWKDK